MVIHDDSLKRLAGVTANVHNLTCEELQSIWLKQGGYTDKIPTLEEVLRYTEGKIDLAVELKLHGSETKNMVDEVVKVMKKYQALESAIFLSTDYSLVEEIKTKQPQTTSGYCMFGGVGSFNPNVVRTMKIDFVFIEEWMATKENLQSFRSAWLPVYVWTVNQQEQMDYLLDLGALGLITDKPSDARSAVKKFDANTNKKYLKEADWID